MPGGAFHVHADTKQLTLPWRLYCQHPGLVQGCKHNTAVDMGEETPGRGVFLTGEESSCTIEVKRRDLWS